MQNLFQAMDLFDVEDYFESSTESAMSRIKCATLIMGVTTDVLFPVQQQRDLADELKRSGWQILFSFLPGRDEVLFSRK